MTKRGNLFSNSKYFLDKSRTVGDSSGALETIKNVPLLTDAAMTAQDNLAAAKEANFEYEEVALLGERLPGENPVSAANGSPGANDKSISREPLFLNAEAPWSAFLCGLQGSGKSHTLSCLLEDCLLTSKHRAFGGITSVSKPRAGIVFHYDSHSMPDQICEAAYLSTLDVPVTVFASKTNLKGLERAYAAAVPKVRVKALQFSPDNINIGRLYEFMAFSPEQGRVPLYMARVKQLLEEATVDANQDDKLTTAAWTQWKADLGGLRLDSHQRQFLDQRIALLERYISKRAKPFKAAPGSLTIIDLTSSMIESSEACVLFSMCLDVFIESKGTAGGVVALDEAHKYLSDTSDPLTDNLLSHVRMQRHYNVRAIIATQEPAISPKLLDLCTMTVVHRFQSPDWLLMLKKHLASVASENGERIFEEIVELQTGQGLLFAPSAVLDVVGGQPKVLGSEYVRFKTRARVSQDGGKSKRS